MCSLGSTINPPKRDFLNTLSVSHLSPSFCLTFYDPLFLDLVYSLYVHLNLRSNGLGDLMKVKIFALRILTIILGELSGSEASNFFFFSVKSQVVNILALRAIQSTL